MLRSILKAPIIQTFDMEYYITRDEELHVPKPYPPHMHDNLEFYIHIEGDASFIVEKSLYKLSPGDVIISKPNEIHNCIINSCSAHKHMCFWFDTSCEFLFKSFLDKDFGTNNHISLSDDEKKELFSICKKIEQSTLNSDKQGEFIHGAELVHYLSSKVSNSNFKKIPANLQKILNYVNKNFASINSIDELAELFFISRSTLCRLFATHLHTTPKSYLESKRLANSRILLKRGSSVFDACVSSGFPDYSNYIRLFKKTFGITPKQYKET